MGSSIEMSRMHPRLVGNSIAHESREKQRVECTTQLLLRNHQAVGNVILAMEFRVCI